MAVREQFLIEFKGANEVLKKIKLKWLDFARLDVE